MSTSLEVGTEIPPWVMETVTPERMRTMAAILRDPNPLHWDRTAVEAIGFGRRCINQGPLGLGYMVNMLHAWKGPECIKRIVMTFPKVVFEGDCVTARGTVTALREENGSRLADCDIWLERDGERLLEGQATVTV